MLSEVVSSNAEGGVTVREAICGMIRALNKVGNRAVREAASPAVEQQVRWLLQTHQAGGVNTTGNLNTMYFAVRGQKGTRVDVENLRGIHLVDL